MGGAQIMRRIGISKTLNETELEFRKIGAARYDYRDPYHAALTVGWGWFSAGAAALYILINLLFALAYFLKAGTIAHARPGQFLDAFFFSIETFATVGYGEMYPADTYSHTVAGVEIIVGMAFTAIATGLIFVRFSKPRAKIVYAERPVVAQYDGHPTLMIRIANARMNVMTDTSVRLSALLVSLSREGQSFRRGVELKLVNSRIAVFAMTFTVLHVIDEDSPLYGLSEEQWIEGRVRLFLTLQAHDPALGVTVHDLASYDPEKVAHGMRYADAVGPDEQGRISVDLRRISLLEPEPEGL